MEHSFWHKTGAKLTHPFKIWQRKREKLFVGGAFVDVDTLALASVFAHRKITALLALVLYYHTFFDKLDGYAKEEGFGGMAYVALSDNGAKGIAKYFSAEKMNALKALFDVKDGDAVLFMGGPAKTINKFAGKVRKSAQRSMSL